MFLQKKTKNKKAPQLASLSKTQEALGDAMKNLIAE